MMRVMREGLSLFSCLFVCFLVPLEAVLRCEIGFCRTQILDSPCSAPAQECSINNATHSGLWMKSPTLCNCCQFCLPFYSANELCSLGGAGAGTTVGRCGAGLTCVAGTNGNYCQRMTAEQSECHARQDQYDANHRQGLSGALEFRPLCDGKGKYGPVDCVPTQTCFCQSEDGQRLFGEAPYQGTVTLQNMQCGCSRANHKIAQNIGAGVPYPVVGPRCTSDGNYNPVQCVHRSCFCVHPLTGVRQGEHMVHLDESPVSELPCYDASQDLYGHYYPNEAPYNYTSPCLQDMDAKVELMQKSQEQGFDVDYFSTVPSCLPDGSHGRVATTTNNTKICIDEWGNRMGDYEAEYGTLEYDDMDCNCAATSAMLSGSLERPVCCRNGSFRPVQCRRGNCRCVDAHGRQIGREASVTALPCYTHNWMTC